ncbi:MAG TPA: PQQ-binding-like beta-propeller repeat protein [Chitinophagaceae bacterium]|nr:PQQ-binding-like beta-propeller repeat protein [Chitinophagaceae bacterium]
MTGKQCFPLLVVSMLVCLQMTAQQKGNSAAVFRGGPGKNGVYPGNDFNHIESKWQYKTAGSIRATPLYHKGRVYSGSSDGNMYCIDALNGKKLWSFNAGSAIQSSAALSGTVLFFTDKKNILYALNANSGKKIWQTNLEKDLVYEWGFDYYQSSPMVQDGIVYVGSGSGAMYALQETDGKVKWTFKTASLVRSSPSWYRNTVYFGDLSGKVYAVNAKTGEKKWQFATTGDTINNEREGNDYKAIIASVALKDDIAVVGGRDGFLYGLDAVNGNELWRHDYEGSWILTSVAIKENTVITGTSDGRVIQAFDLRTGKELWKYKTTSTVWASPVVVGSMVIAVVNDGFIYCLDLGNGKEKCRYRLGDRALSSPVFNGDVIYIGNDDGNISALTTSNKAPSGKPVRKAVFYTSDVYGKYIRPGMNTVIRDYFVAEGYELLNEEKLPAFLEANSNADVSSVVVFAAGYFQPAITTGPYRNSILYRYLAGGGKIVVLGVNPALHRFDHTAKEYKGLDYSLTDSIIGITYRHNDLRSHYGFYSSIPTVTGKKWGLTQTMPGYAAVTTDQVTPLAIDENGRAAY